MRVEGSYRTPIYGVSTLSPRNRMSGLAGKQVNFRSDPVRKLIRRPSSNWINKLLDDVTKADLYNHSYERNGRRFRYIVDTDSEQVHCFIDEVFKETIAAPTGYMEDSLVSQSVEHETYFVNPDKVVEVTTDTDESLNVIERVAHINVLSALNYGESLQVNITLSDNSRHTVTYTVPDLGISNPDYDTADKARATKQVAFELAARINGGGVYTTPIPNPAYPNDPHNDPTFMQYCQEYRDDGAGGCEVNPDYDPTNTVCNAYLSSYSGITGVTAVALGSSVAVWEDGRADWLHIEIETGQGDRSTVAINQEVEKVDGLPLFAVVGTRIKVQPDPTTDKGVYYLQAERIAEVASGEELEEVVWVESRSATEPYKFDNTTTPFKVVYNESTDTFTQTTVSFKDRLRGDNTSVKVPAFVGNTITNLGYFQKRLVLLTENTVVVSETDDPDNFWKQSAVQLLVSDATSTASSAVGIDKLRHVIPHNRDLLVIASNGQFKIDGNTAITPQTLSLSLTTGYECQVEVEPVVSGNSVYYPINYGESTGVQEYTGERDTSQDIATAVTSHVIGYMSGQAEILKASPNLDMLAIATKDAPNNIVYIFERFKANSEDTPNQMSWSEWVLPETTDIIDIEFNRDKLTLLAIENGNLVVKEIDLYARTADSSTDIYLDDYLALPTTGTTCTIPDGYSTTGATCVRGAGTDYELNQVNFTVDGNTLTFEEDIGAGVVHLGKLFESRYQPTRPFVYDEKGIAVTTDRIRVNRFILNLVNTNQVFMEIISDYYTTNDQEFNSRFVGGLNNVVGEIPSYTGDIKFSFKQDADLALAEFYCNNHLGCAIAGISWEGQYYKSKGRI